MYLLLTLLLQHKEVAVGVMCLNTQIDFDALEENYELAIYAGLRRYPENLKAKLPKFIDSTVSLLVYT